MKNGRPFQTATGALETLERWSFRAAAGVALGVFGEAVREVVFRKPGETPLELAWAVISNAIVFVCVVGEAYCVFAAIRWTRGEKAEADRSVAAATSATAEIRKKHVDLEIAVSPRILEQTHTSEALKAHAGVSCIVLSSNDTEPRRAAGQIRLMLELAGWNMVRPQPPSNRRPFLLPWRHYT